ncbi:MAG: ATP synthase F0 subunit B [Myxococcota bacterium]|jgi:F-type H+-transporting ATPase subunit b|nr:ATP synthase F0 subunit B [Myxococcota bacterium]
MSKPQSCIRFLVALGLTLLVAGTAFAAGGDGHAIDYDNLHINWWGWDDHAPPVGWFIVDFILFVGLLVYFTKRPVGESFKERAIGIKLSIENAEKAYRGAQKNHSFYQEKNTGLEKEVIELKEQSESAGITERDARIKNAKSYGERMRRDAQKVIDQELDKAHVRLKNTVAQKALHLAEEWIRSGLSDADRQGLTEDAIVQLESGLGASQGIGVASSTAQGAQL